MQAHPNDGDDQVAFPSRVGKQHQAGSVGARKGFNRPTSQIQFGDDDAEGRN